jgi:pantoate--beta-alanine ligase
LDRDVALLRERGCDLVFAPPAEEIYRPEHATFVDVGPLGRVLEGEFRPTHFRGVATVVLKLFLLVPADRAYFGRKDYQQTLVVRQLVADLNVPIDVRVCPIVREADGLAMSSRNAYLSDSERQRALALPRSLRLAEELVSSGERDVAVIRRRMEREIEVAGGVVLQYIALVADGTVNPVERIDGPTTVAVAATVGETRLIDNTLVSR